MEESVKFKEKSGKDINKVDNNYSYYLQYTSLFEQAQIIQRYYRQTQRKQNNIEIDIIELHVLLR